MNYWTPHVSRNEGSYGSASLYAYMVWTGTTLLFTLTTFWNVGETAASTTVPPPLIYWLWNCYWIECVHSWDLQAVKNVKTETVYYQAMTECQQPNILTSKLEEISLLNCKTGANSEGFGYLGPLENATDCPDFRRKYKSAHFSSPYTILSNSIITVLVSRFSV